MDRRPGVALIRGGALNPYETQSYALLKADFDIVAIGSRVRANPMEYVDIPYRLLPTASTFARKLGGRRSAGFANHSLARLGRSRFDAERLVGFSRAVGKSAILHSAETVLPVSQQAAERVARGSQVLILTCWETIPFRYDDDQRLSDRKEIVKAATSLFLAVTERARRALLAEGVPEERIAVVPAGVDCSRFRPGPKCAALRKEWGVPSGHPIILYVGRLIQEKGLLELVRAFALQSRRDSHLVFVGAGNQGPRIMRAAQALGVYDRIYVRSAAPYRSLPQIYATADVVVAPSLPTPYWEEQFGMVLVETMACGRPLVSTMSGAIPEVVGDGGRLVSPYDVAGLADAIEEVLSDGTLATSLGEAGRRRATSLYDVNVVAGAVRAHYLKLLS